MASRHRFQIVPGPAVIALCLLGIAKPAHATNNCPWINEATVSGLLEGQAVGDFNQGQVGQPAMCSFVRKTAGGTRTLTISVETTSDAHARVKSIVKGCTQQPEVLPAIGNEAYVCLTQREKKAVTERVIGRVRVQVFTIEISANGTGDAALSMGEVKSRISIASEQVSGNLF